MKTNKYSVKFKEPYLLIDEFITKDWVLTDSYIKVCDILNKEYGLTEDQFEVTAIEEVVLFKETKRPVRVRSGDLHNINVDREIKSRRKYDT